MNKAERVRSAMLLYAVTDRAWTGKQPLMEQVDAALRGGATCVQLREKQLDRAAFLEEALEIGRLCRAAGVPFLVNDDVRIAAESGADGAHVGQSDMEAGEARALLGEEAILGVSVRTVEQALAAERAGADYLGVGAVFATATKADAAEVSREALRAICAAVKIPVVAIGGISRENLPSLAGTGIDGVALVSAIFGADDIEAACRDLKKLSEEAVRR